MEQIIELVQAAVESYKVRRGAFCKYLQVKQLVVR
jgi:hypothetical protein